MPRRIFQALIVTVGLVSGGLGIYTYFFSRPEIEFQVLNVLSDYSLNGDVIKVDSTFKWETLPTKKENLVIITLRVTNVGSQDILKSYYDEKDPIGLNISNGRIIGISKNVTASNSYLSSNLSMNPVSNNIFFSDMILEVNQYYEIRIFTICNNGEIPTFKSMGKIAGQKDIQISQSEKSGSFYKDVFYGNIFVHAVRLVVYLGFIATLVACLVFGGFVYDKYVEKQRLKETERKIRDDIDQFKQYMGKSLNESHFTILELYSKYGWDIIEKGYELLQDQDKLNRLSGGFFSREVHTLMNKGFITMDNNRLTIVNSKKIALDEFVEYIIRRRRR